MYTINVGKVFLNYSGHWRVDVLNNEEGIEAEVMGKSTDNSSGGPGFNFQHPQSSSQLSITLVSWDLTHSCGHYGHQECT